MPTVKNYQDREKYIAYAKKVESDKGIPQNLLVGLLGAESAFREDIITGKKLSSAGAIGIGQFMPKTAKEYGIDPLDPYASIEAAGKYLTKSYKALGNWDDALRSYNMGVQGVKNVKSGKWKISKETADYVGRVYDNAKIFGEGINLPTQTYADKEPTNNITNFEPMGQMRNFASVPDLKEEPKEAVVTETESTQKLKERAFLEDYNRLIAQPQQQVAQQEEEVIPLMQDNTEEIFNDTSQFIDEGFAQEGGKFSYRRNNQPLETVRESTQVRNNFNPTLFSTTARNLTEQELRDKKTKEYQRIANERRVVREKANKNPLNQGLNIITNSSLNTRDNWAETAAGLESQFRVSDKPNFFDDYINPANMIGGMASNLGQSSKEARDSDSVLPYFTSVGAPLAVGALAGIGANSTKQFVNNVANPLAGTGDLTKSFSNIKRNVSDIKELNSFSKKYGYDETEGIKKYISALSSNKTDNLYKNTLNQHNTFIRGVSTNVENMPDEVKNYLTEKGIDYVKNPQQAAEYMATHVPPKTGYGRVWADGLEDKTDVIYTSNSAKTGEGYTYGDGYIVKVKKPTDYTSLERRDWINKNNPETFSKPSMDIGVNTGNFKSVVKTDYVPYESMTFQGKLNDLGKIRGQAEAQKLQNIAEKDLELLSLQEKLNASFKELQSKKITSDKYWEVNKEISSNITNRQEDLYKNFTGGKNINPYAHYLHYGDVGSKILEPVESFRITPDEWVNKSRAHKGEYTQGLSRLQEGGIIDDNEGQWKYPGEVTRISSPNITMKNVPYPVLGVADTGEQKMMYPNLDYTFKGANSVTEYPQLTAKEKQFLKALKNDRTRIHN